MKGTAKILARDLRKRGGGERENRPSPPHFPPVLFSRSRCYSDIGIPIPKTIVIWASPPHINIAIWVRVRVTGDAHITRGFGSGDAQNAGMPIWHAYHCGSAFSISRTRLSRSLEWLVVTLTICCRVHIFDTFSCGNKAVLILPRGQDRPVLPDRVANRIRSNFLPRGASRTIYYNYRIIKEACVQAPPPPFSVMRGKPKKNRNLLQNAGAENIKITFKTPQPIQKKALKMIHAWAFDSDINERHFFVNV